MSYPDFKTQTKNIREEALKLGFSIRTMNGYKSIWNQYIRWKSENDFVYNSLDYDKFLLEYYNFDVRTYTPKSKSWHQNLMRSKRILDNFDVYKKIMTKRVLPVSLYNDYPKEWNNILDDFLNYCKDVQNNSDNTIILKRNYLKALLSYFSKNDITSINDLNKTTIINFVNNSIQKGNVAKRRTFYVLREFLKYLFIEDILKEDLSFYVPQTKRQECKKIPTYIKQNEIETLLKSIPKTKKTDIRNYTIILIAARLGLRISDILNIKLKDIDWQNKRLNITQPKTNNLNILPLSKEVGWAIINYIKVRPECNNEYLFVKTKYPFEKLQQFNTFNKYFDKVDININENNKKGIHNLRHSLAKNMLDNDIPLNIISSTLGHSNINSTNTYLKVDFKNLKKCGLEVD